jgi:hypothetical protein
MLKATEMITTKAPKSGSLSSSTPTATMAQAIGRKSFLEIMHVRHLAHRVVGRVEDGAKFHQLGRLQVDDAKRKPTLRAVDLAAHTGNQHQGQEQAAADEEPRGPLLPTGHRHLKSDGGGE